MLREAVASVIGQTHTDWELVVVANACADRLDDLEGLDPRIRVLRETRPGVSRARNLGAAATQATYLAFLDDDDLCLPDRLGRQVALLEADSTAGICSGGFQRIDVTGTAFGRKCGALRQYADILGASFDMLMSTIMIRRHLFNTIGGFDPALVTGEDIDFLLRAGQNSRFAFVDATVVYYRQHDNNSGGNPWTSQQDIAPILRKHRRWARRQGRDDLVMAAGSGLRRVRQINARSAYDAARQARSEGDYGRLAKAAVTSLAIDPIVAIDDLAHYAFRAVASGAPSRRRPV